MNSKLKKEIYDGLVALCCEVNCLFDPIDCKDCPIQKAIKITESVVN
jgi:hypothetical protein